MAHEHADAHWTEWANLEPCLYYASSTKGERLKLGTVQMMFHALSLMDSAVCSGVAARGCWGKLPRNQEAIWPELWRAKEARLDVLMELPCLARVVRVLQLLQVCADVAMVCEQMGVSRVIVGHTVQTSGEVSEMCGGKLVMADVALSRAMGSRELGDVMGLECRAEAAHANHSAAELVSGLRSTGSAGAGEGQTASEAVIDQGKLGPGQEQVCRWVSSKEGACRQANERNGVLRVWRMRSGAPVARLLSNPFRQRTSDESGWGKGKAQQGGILGPFGGACAK
eukprot:1141992-Pelagomonas_calceolata.AAC.6